VTSVAGFYPADGLLPSRRPASDERSADGARRYDSETRARRMTGVAVCSLEARY